MASPESSRGTRIPSLSWESVVDDPSSTGAIDDRPPSATESHEMSASPVAPVASPPEPITFAASEVEPAPSEPITFAPMELSTSPLAPSGPPAEQPSLDVAIPPLGAAIPVLGDLGGAEPPPADPRPSTRVPVEIVDDPVVTPEPAPAAEPAAASTPPASGGTTIRPSAEMPAVAPSPRTSGGTTITPSAEVPAVAPSPRTSGGTTITPSAEVPVSLPGPEAPADDSAARVDAPDVAEAPAPDVAPPAPSGTTADPVDALPPIREATPVPDGGPAIAPSSPALPHVPAAAAAPSPAPAHAVAAAPIASPAPQSASHRPRRGLTLLFTIVVLSALVAAAVVFGPRYLFPDEWDPAAKPYAEAVETVRGVEIAEPVAVVAQPVGAYDTRAATELFGERSDDQPTWRALGLLNGTVQSSTTGELLSGWTSASYSPTDGQVYHDDAVAGAVLDSALTESMAAAALDQEYAWSVDQGDRSLDAAALVGAEVLRQSRSVRSASEFSAPVPEPAPGLLLFLPPVLGYEAMAPAVYAQFALASEPGDPADVVDGGGVLPAAVTDLAPAPTMIPGDTVLTSPRAESRSFWFLVFGAYLDSRSAYVASEAVVESSLTVAQRTETQCAYATFAGGNVEQNGVVRSTLERWVAAAPAELSASFSVLPDGTLQLSSCDPGVGFENPVRGGVARELIGWRVAELTTVEAVRAADGSAEDLARSWAAVEASNVGVELGALPGETVASDIAEAARSAVTAVFFPES